MNLNELLQKHGRTVADVTKIYSGLEHCCRCGCGGKYFEPGDRGFARALNAIAKPGFEPVPKGVTMWRRGSLAGTSDGIAVGETYGLSFVDIPYGQSNDKCYCLYFD